MNKIVRISGLIGILTVLLNAQNVHAVVLHDIPGGDFSSPNFSNNKPSGTMTGGQWGYYEILSTSCNVIGAGDDRHAEIKLDWGWRGASIMYTDDDVTPADQAWRISADLRASLGYYEARSPGRWISLQNTGGNDLLTMKFFPDMTVEWSTPTQSGTFTSATGIDGTAYQKVHFDYDPRTGMVSAGLNNEVIFSITTTPGLSASILKFIHLAGGQGTGTFYIDNIVTEMISSPGDVNCDGFVDSIDVAIINVNLGIGPRANWRQGDVSGNGIVDVTDLNIVTANLGQSSAAPTSLLTEIIPEPKQVYTFNNQRGPFCVSAATSIVLDTNADDLVKRGAALLQEDFNTLYGLSIGITYQSLAWGKKGFVLCNNTANVQQISNNLHMLLMNISDHGDESYRLAGDSQGIIIDSPASAGLFYGMQTLRQMLRSNATIPALVISDWPDQAIRACYLGFPTAPEGLVKKMARLKINMCVVESRWYAGGNWWYNPYGNNRIEAQTFMNLCRQYNIEPVPLVQGLGWAYGVLDINPNCAEGIWVQDESKTLNGTIPVNLSNPNVIQTVSAPIVVTNTNKTITYTQGTDYQIIAGVTARPFDITNTPWQIARISTGRIANRQNVLVNYNYMNYSPSQSPYCPSEPLTNQIVDDTLQNVINIYQPMYIHIGHDELTYAGRCSRCLQSGKNALQLIGDDINHWYNKLKTLNPNIKIMMWDDLLRSNATYGSAIASVPGDVIICPWVYGYGAGSYYDPASRQEIDSRMNWFLKTNARPTLGAASGYWHNNIRDWKDSVTQHANNSNCQGFMFTWWGDASLYWSGLSYASEYMWSREKTNQTIYNFRIQGDQICRPKGVGLTLSLYDQRDAFAQLVNDATDAGTDARTDADVLAGQLNELASQIKLSIVSELATANVAAGTIPERVVTQLESLPDYYWSMGAYVEAGRLSNQGNKPAALVILNQITDQFKRWRFHGHENAASWVTNYQNNNVFPTSQEMFGVTLTIPNTPSSDIPGDANYDGKVDVGDLGILAANYGKSISVTWSTGDFNGDGMVDVGDLGILAANYGTGSQQSLDFTSDYAKAFDTIMTDSTSDDEISSSTCSNMGLPLIAAGLVMMSLMLIKREG